MKTSCQTQMKYYPFDTQFCEYRFGSWSLTKDKLTFRHVTPYKENPNYGDLVIDNTFHYNSTQWEIRSGMGELREKEYPCCPRVEQFAMFKKTHLCDEVIKYRKFQRNI